jgi:hypothetical protein
LKRLILCLSWVCCAALFSSLAAQDVQVESLDLGSIMDIPMKVASTPGAVLALAVHICDSSWEPHVVIDYESGQTWYMMIYAFNNSSSSQSFKLEYDLRYKDGAGYYVYRTAVSIPSYTWKAWRVSVTSYVAKLGLLTLTGRVYGTAMGNDNKVTGQVYVY